MRNMRYLRSKEEAQPKEIEKTDQFQLLYQVDRKKSYIPFYVAKMIGL